MKKLDLIGRRFAKLVVLKEHPETVGETDRHFDLDNYKDWLEAQLIEARILIIILLIALSGCSKKTYQPVELEIYHYTQK